MVSFHPSEGWTVAGGDVPTPPEYLYVWSIGVGHYGIVCYEKETPGAYTWSAYDTISGETMRLPDLEFSCRMGMFYPALAVPSYPDKLHYIDPALVYPHSDLKWGIIPPSAVVVPADE
ncbi:hypothetical protein KIPB_016888 [Kipferlia bialata]|uniref:Uncharacterized protein n=1 Tax=Kipferlia bialata TaxID=797122 RepID=A0A391NW49_9EUKA|nr:hypothetical protein KIPB_016888 [Kipferlia bialata]|eukprot:g16888.t1